MKEGIIIDIMRHIFSSTDGPLSYFVALNTPLSGTQRFQFINDFLKGGILVNKTYSALTMRMIINPATSNIGELCSAGIELNQFICCTNFQKRSQ